MFNLFKDKNPISLANKAYQTTDPKKAVDLYSDAIKYEKAKSQPDKSFLSDLYLFRGQIYFNQGVAILSSSDFLHSLEHNPQNATSHNNLGIWFTIEFFATPDYTRALEHLDKAVSYSNNNQEFRMNRAVVKIQMGDKDIGRSELEELQNEGYSDATIAIERFC
ncbi:MAG: hypothetical protein V4613_07850 [Bacteroidota bacterium]